MHVFLNRFRQIQQKSDQNIDEPHDLCFYKKMIRHSSRNAKARPLFLFDNKMTFQTFGKRIDPSQEQVQQTVYSLALSQTIID